MNRAEYLTRAREFASRGTSRPNSRLNPEKVKEIRKNAKGKTAKQLAQFYGVHYRTIEKVQYFETWAHIED